MATKEDEYMTDEELDAYEPPPAKQAKEPVDKEALFKRLQGGVDEEKRWLEEKGGEVYKDGEGLEEVFDRSTD